MDGYVEYNKTRLEEKVQEKTSFLIEDDLNCSQACHLATKKLRLLTKDG